MAIGLTDVFRQVAVTNTAVLVIAGDVCLMGWNLINSIGTAAYLKFYNAATAAAVTVGTTAVVRTLYIPASGTAVLSNEGAFQRQFSLGMVIAVTTGIADNNSAAPSTGPYVEILYANNP